MPASAVILSGFGLVESIIIILMKSKYSILHILDGMIPIIMFPLYFCSLYHYSDLYWTTHSLVMINLAPFFCLCATRIIIAVVAKQRFSCFEDIHLIVPTLLSVVIFPINKICGLGLNEHVIYIFLMVTGYFMYFWYIVHSIN